VVSSPSFTFETSARDRRSKHTKMPPRRAPPRGGAATKDAPAQKDKVNTATTSTRTTRAAKRAASQAPSQAPEPLPSSSQEATLPTTPKKRASRAKAATTKKSGKIVENVTSAIELDNEEPAEDPIPTPRPANKTRGKAKVEVHPEQPIATRQTRGKKSTTEPEPKPADNGTKQRATRKNTNGEKAEEIANIPKPKARATTAKRGHVVAADEEVLNDATQGTPKLRKVEPGSVSNSRKIEGEEEGSSIPYELLFTCQRLTFCSWSETPQAKAEESCFTVAYQ